MTARLIPVRDRYRLKVYCTAEGVLIVHEELRTLPGGEAWCVTDVEPVRLHERKQEARA